MARGEDAAGDSDPASADAAQPFNDADLGTNLGPRAEPRIEQTEVSEPLGGVRDPP